MGIRLFQGRRIATATSVDLTTVRALPSILSVYLRCHMIFLAKVFLVLPHSNLITIYIHIYTPLNNPEQSNETRLTNHETNMRTTQISDDKEGCAGRNNVTCVDPVCKWQDALVCPLTIFSILDL